MTTSQIATLEKTFLQAESSPDLPTLQTADDLLKGLRFRYTQSDLLEVVKTIVNRIAQEVYNEQMRPHINTLAITVEEALWADYNTTGQDINHYYGSTFITADAKGHIIKREFIPEDVAIARHEEAIEYGYYEVNQFTKATPADNARFAISKAVCAANNSRVFQGIGLTLAIDRDTLALSATSNYKPKHPAPYKRNKRINK